MTSQNEPSPQGIAIVAMACRFPGASDPERFWNNLSRGEQAIRRFDEAELREAGVAPALSSDPKYVPAKGYLAETNAFDAALFDMAQAEAAGTDPQLRLGLELAWEALEGAGHAPGHPHTRIGVFAGTNRNTGWRPNTAAPQLPGDTGTSHLENARPGSNLLAQRISQVLNLHGPSLDIQAGSATSLVAIHLACQALFTGDCDMALAGGICLQFPDKAGYRSGAGRPLSARGACHPFDARADGTVPGDGAGLVALKRLEDARLENETILAVIRGSAVNHSGVRISNGGEPDIQAQTEVIAEALAVAQISADSIGYVECHGSGSPVHDRGEVEALTRAFRYTSRRQGYCALGAVKANLGHLGPAAGIAGLIKTVQILKRGQIPITPGFDRPHPDIPFAASPFFLNRHPWEWVTADVPRRAGVSAFGLGGTNAHLVLEQAPAPTPAEEETGPFLLAISAHDDQTLTQSLDRLAHHLGRPAEEGTVHQTMADIAFTLQTGRAALPSRAVLVTYSREEAAGLLSEHDRKRMLRKTASRAMPVAFLFPGQGAQYPRMASQLYQTEPVFARTLDACFEGLRDSLPRDPHQVLFPRPGQADLADLLHDTEYTQPILFSVEMALAHLWQSWGVKPDRMIGHSLGEYSAACLAGVWHLEEALNLVALRGRLMAALPRGAMLTVELSEDELGPLLEGDLALAAVNGPHRCVASGPEAGIEALATRLGDRNVGYRRLTTSHAFHSPTMDRILDTFHAEVLTTSMMAPQIPFISNLTGTWIREQEACDPMYWVRHLRHTVRFTDGLATLLRDAPRLALLEVGPGRSLTSLAGQHPSRGAEHPILASLRHPQTRIEDREFLLNSLGKLWLAGLEVDWHAVHATRPRRRVFLPTYPFRRQHFAMPSFVAVPPQTEVSPTVVQDRTRPPNSTVPARETCPTDDHSHFGTAPLHPLTRAQQRLWVLEMLGRVGTAYNMPIALQLRGDLNREALVEALRVLTNRHDVLRTRFTQSEDRPGQIILDRLEPDIATRDLRGEADPMAAALALAEREALHRFQLGHPPLWRVRLWRTGDEDHLLFLNFHHIICDGWSVRILFREWSALYNAFREGHPNPLAPVQTSYREAVADLEADLRDDSIQESRAYWHRQLVAPLPVLELPTDRPRSRERRFSGATYVHDIDAPSWQRFKDRAAQEEATPFAALLALVATLLHRTSHQTDMIIGCPVSGREQPGLADVMGFFVNPLPIRLRIQPRYPFEALLRQASERVGDALANGSMPFDTLVEELMETRDLTRSPLFDVMVLIQEPEIKDLSLEGLQIEERDLPWTTSKFDLTFYFFTDGPNLTLRLNYDTDLFHKSRIAAMCAQLEQLLTDVTAHPTKSIARLAMLPGEERKKLLRHFNETGTTYPRTQTLVDLFALRVTEQPGRPAVVGLNAKGRTESLCYDALAHRAHGLAHRIHRIVAHEAEPIVALLTDRSPNAVVAMLAVLEAGAAYMPLDPTYPPDRLSFMLDDSQCRLLLFTPAQEDTARQLKRQRPELDLLPVEGQEAAQGPTLTNDSDAAAYVIYTSGSTGTPKGCVLTHRNLVRLLCNARFPLSVGETDVWLCAHNFSFDFSVWEIFGALLHGGQVVLAQRDQVLDPDRLLDLIRAHRVTVLSQTPAAFHGLMTAELDRPYADLDQHLRYVVFGGDRLEPGELRAWVGRYDLERIQLVNMYGITETCIHVTYGPLSPRHILEGQEPGYVGKPLPDTRIYVVDEALELCPIGVPGEILVAGGGLCRGYLNRPSRNARSFVPLPFAGYERAYRSGDRGMWSPEGHLIHLGRIDHQVQVRGFRIEPGEIEAVLNDHPDVGRSLVLPISDGHQVHGLHAFVEPLTEGEIDTGELFTFMHERLPAHLIPNRLVAIAQFPMTANGKIDRTAMTRSATHRTAKASREAGAAQTTSHRFRAPMGPLETRIAEIWISLLEPVPDNLGAEDPFFEVGGNSLLLMRLAFALKAAFEVELSAGDLFLATTIAAQAALIEERLPAQTGTDERTPDAETTSLRAAVTRRATQQIRAQQARRRNPSRRTDQETEPP